MSLTLTTSGDREVVISRAFDAPARLVFDAYTRPDLLRRWLLGPPGWEMPTCTVDLRVGGKYRYAWSSNDGRTMGMTGTYEEIVPGRRLVGSEVFDDDWTGGPAVQTIEFIEKDGRTTVVHTIRYASKEARDGALATGMTTGMEAGYERLDALLADERARHGA
jgi:uncharacterized protein YndB with AHSA1/START domain